MEKKSTLSRTVEGEFVVVMFVEHLVLRETPFFISFIVELFASVQ